MFRRLGGLLFFLGAEAIQLFDEEKDGKRSNGEADDVSEEEPVIDSGSARFLRRFEGRIGFFGEIPVEFGKIDLIEEKSQGRHHNV